MQYITRDGTKRRFKTILIASLEPESLILLKFLFNDCQPKTIGIVR